MTKPLAVVAVGGNALILDDQHMALADQYDAVCETATHVAAMIAAGWNVVLTHGNGPQVGFILRRSEIADGQVPTVPVQYAVADTQGAIGYMFQNALGNALVAARHPRAGRHAGHADAGRPARPRIRQARQADRFVPDGRRRQAAGHRAGWTVMQDASRGWRRAIASPQPVRVVEAPIIERLAREGVLVIACGGGGIAVEELANGELRGVEAVIDKDLASALLGDRDERRPAGDSDRRAARRDPLRPARRRVARPNQHRASRGLRCRGPLRRGQHGAEDRGRAQLRQAAPGRAAA